MFNVANASHDTPPYGLLSPLSSPQPLGRNQYPPYQKVGNETPHGGLGEGGGICPVLWARRSQTWKMIDHPFLSHTKLMWLTKHLSDQQLPVMYLFLLLMRTIISWNSIPSILMTAVE
jgi:hypothetical protein